MGSSKNISRTTSDYTQVLQRLNQALNLGTRSGRKWKSSDILVQRQLIRSVSAFLDSESIRTDALNNPNLKGTISDAVGALAWILENTNAVTLSSAAEAALKLIAALPRPVLKSHAMDLVRPLSSAISSRRIEVAVPCSKALSLALYSCPKDESTLWRVLAENKIVRFCVDHLKSFAPDLQSVASLLSTILRRFPRSRFLVWSDDDLTRILCEILENADSESTKVEVLVLLSAIALCGTGAEKLLENGESLLKATVKCMGSSQSESVRLEAFRLVRYLAMNERRYSKMRSLCCEPVVEAIIIGMSKASRAEMAVAVEACRLASIARWDGDHHGFFWKHGIGNVLLDLLVENSRARFFRDSPSLEKQFSIALACLNSNHLPGLRSYLWDILGWLAIHGKKGFKPEGDGQRLSLYVLISYACSTFVDAIHKHQKLCQVNLEDTLRSEPATRAVLMMIYSPCEYIASNARSTLSELLNPNGKKTFEHFVSTMKHILARNSLDRPQLVIYATVLSCLAGLEEPREWVLEFSGTKLLSTLVRRCVSKGIEDSKEQSFSSRNCHDSLFGHTCCDFYSEEWEGKDTLLFYSLFGLAELMRHSEPVKTPELFESLHDACTKISSPGVRWLASYALSSLGLYGFPRKLSRRIEKVLHDEYYTDSAFVLKSGERLSVHRVVLAVRCPSLLRKEEVTELRREIRFSGCVDRAVLMKLLGFLYLGYLRAGEEGEEEEGQQTMTVLKAFAKHCELSSLVQVLSRRRPKWGAPYPSLDLSLALGPLGHPFSDVVFEAKTNEMREWKCDFCSSSVPHVHAHKAIMTASSDYFRALFTSGMQESLSETIKLDLSWKAVVKLVEWSYTDELPSPPIGCLWSELSDEEKLSELEPYFELCSLAKGLCIEEVEEACSDVIASRLASERHLAVKIIVIAVGFALWNLVDIALTYAAPRYRQLLASGELEDLDEALVDMIRSASVQYTQGDF